MGRLYAFDDNGASKGARLCTANDIAEAGLHSVYLSGNGPLVAILTEALARDRIAQERRHGARMTLLMGILQRPLRGRTIALRS